MQNFNDSPKFVYISCSIPKTKAWHTSFLMPKTWNMSPPPPFLFQTIVGSLYTESCGINLNWTFQAFNCDSQLLKSKQQTLQILSNLLPPPPLPIIDPTAHPYMKSHHTFSHCLCVGRSSKALLAFSLATNAPAVLSLKRPESSMGALDGIRVLSMIWIIWHHVKVMLEFTLGKWPEAPVALVVSISSCCVRTSLALVQ